MALFIHFTLSVSGNTSISSNAVYVGQDLPAMIKPENVLWVQADGEERGRCLDLTSLSFESTPRVLKVYGDLAKLIVGNWKH